MNDLPTVDIIIPAKNEAANIDNVLTAVHEQSYPRVLVNTYVVDNGSTDSTAIRVKEHDAVLLTLPQGTAAAARNFAILQGTGAMLAFLDADCIPDPDWLSRLIERVSESCAAAVQGTIENRFASRACNWLASTLSPDQKWQRVLKQATYPAIAIGNALLRRDAAESIGLFDESFGRCDDLDLSWRLILAGYQLEFAPEARVVHHIDDSLLRHLQKRYLEGAAFAKIAQKFNLKKEGAKLLDLTLEGEYARSLITNLCWNFGNHAGQILSALTKAHREPNFQAQIDQSLRPQFRWNDERYLAISRQVVFWAVNPSYFICVNPRASTRFELVDTAAIFFAQLVKGTERNAAASLIANQFEMSVAEAEQELDEFVGQLLDNGVLVSKPADAPYSKPVPNRLSII